MIDLTGIENQHEFYTNHYLSSILEQDLKDVFRTWRERDEQEKIRPPYAQLRGLYKEYFTTRSQLEREKKVEDRLTLQREIERRLLEVLGYAFEPTFKELVPGLIPHDEVRSFPGGGIAAAYRVSLIEVFDSGQGLFLLRSVQVSDEQKLGDVAYDAVCLVLHFRTAVAAWAWRQGLPWPLNPQAGQVLADFEGPSVRWCGLLIPGMGP